MWNRYTFYYYFDSSCCFHYYYNTSVFQKPLLYIGMGAKLEKETILCMQQYAFSEGKSLN